VTTLTTYVEVVGFLRRCDTEGGRIVSMNDLTEMQIAEAKVTGRAFVDENGFGFALLPWSLVTERDIDRDGPIKADSQIRRNL
jgi:hypothetical protein